MQPILRSLLDLVQSNNAQRAETADLAHDVRGQEYALCDTWLRLNHRVQPRSAY